MIIRKFLGNGLHGYINADVIFFDDITFLFGINGSGKTTVVRLINALLAPSFAVLAETEFKSMELHFEIDGKRRSIQARSSHIDTTVSIDGEPEELTIPRYSPDENLPYNRQDDNRSEWYSNFSSQVSNHPVVKAIDALPSPLYLGLERRSGTPMRRFPRPPWAGRGRALSSSLQASLDDASSYASLAFRDAYTAESKLKDDLRNDLILSSFKFHDVFRGVGRGFSLPPKSSIKKTPEQHQKIIDVLSTIGIDQRKLETSVGGFFKELSDIINDLPAEIKKDDPLQTKGYQKLFRYQFNKLQFDRAEEIVARVEKFTSDVKQIYKSIDDFRALINGFLHDSGKEIILDLNGLWVNIPKVGKRPAAALSSGEQQLIVLLTHLWFNNNTRSSGVLIIDEPELSLHLAWQEMFVDALLKAHSGLQLILATHSPTIILERIDKSIELIPQYADVIAG